MLYYVLLYYIVLYFAMLEMTPNPFQEDGFGIPSHCVINSFQEDGFGIPSHYMILYYIQLTYTILRYNVQWRRWHPMHCKKLDLKSHLTIWDCTILNWHMLYFKILCCTMVHHILQWWEGNQSFSRRWIWHPISLYDTILYSIDVYYLMRCPTGYTFCGTLRHGHY